MYLSTGDRKLAADILVQRLSQAALLEAVPTAVARMVTDAERQRGTVSSRELAEFLLDLHGADLLAQPKLRLELCKSLDAGVLMDLRDAAGFTGRASRRTAAREVAERRWFTGRWWASYFAATIGFPPVFAGMQPASAEPDHEDVEAFRRPPELYDYQQELCDRVIELLRASPGQNRGIVSLPTGAGKTRTVVEALVRSFRKRVFRGAHVLWIAQSEELCEQAFDTFREVWLANGEPGETLRLHRFWGMRDFPDLHDQGVVIASIQKLYQAAQSSTEEGKELERLSGLLAAVVVDEAHHAIASSYVKVFSVLGLDRLRRRGSAVPLLGLTATPYRGDEGTKNLERLFYGNLLVPTRLRESPIAKLQQLGILARASHEVIHTGCDYEMTENETRLLETFAEFPESFVKRIGADGERNRSIIDRLLRMDSRWPVLFFGCSVEHACAIAVLLRRRQVSAAVITSKTRREARRAILQEFKAGNIRVLCNYGILTTGFDAPDIRAVVVARPTASAVLYEQMVGRGMRGVKNNGTDECLIIDFADNLDRFGVQMAHTRFAEYWQSNRSTQR